MMKNNIHISGYKSTITTKDVKKASTITQAERDYISRTSKKKLVKNISRLWSEDNVESKIWYNFPAFILPCPSFNPERANLIKTETKYYFNNKWWKLFIILGIQPSSDQISRDGLFFLDLYHNSMNATCIALDALGIVYYKTRECQHTFINISNESRETVDKLYSELYETESKILLSKGYVLHQHIWTAVGSVCEKLLL